MKIPIVFTLQKRIGSLDVLKTLVRGASIALGIQIAGNAIGYLGQILLARWLGLRDYGNFTFLVTWAQVLSIGALMGLDYSVVRFIPEYAELGGWGFLKGILFWGRRIVLITGMILAAASALVLLWIHPIQSPAPTVLLGSALIMLIAFSEIQTQIIRSIKRIAWAYGPPIVLNPLLMLGTAIVLMWILGRLADFQSLAAMSVSLCVVIAIQGVVIHNSFPDLTRKVAAVYDVRRWISVSLPLLFNSIFAVIVLKMDTLLVGFFLGSEEVGIYSAAVKTATMVGIAFLAANIIIGPMIAAHYARRDMGGLQNIVSAASLGSFIATLLIGTGVILLSGPIMGAFGEAFLRARIPLFILIAGQLVNVGSGSVGWLLILTGHEKKSMMVLGVCAMLIAVFCILVIPRFGIIGAATVSMLGLSLWNVWSYRLVVSNLGIHPSIFFAFRKIFLGKGMKA